MTASSLGNCRTITVYQVKFCAGCIKNLKVSVNFPQPFCCCCCRRCCCCCSGGVFLPSVSDNLAESGLTSMGSIWRIQKKKSQRDSLSTQSCFLRPLVQSYTFRREGLEQSPAPVSMFKSMSSTIIQAELLPQKI